jgi:hypothetical protein
VSLFQEIFFIKKLLLFGGFVNRQEIVMLHYYYDAEDKAITFCGNDEVNFSGELSWDNSWFDYHVHNDWCVGWESIFDIEDLGYSVEVSHDFHEWNGGRYSGYGSTPPKDLQEILDRIDDAFEKFIADHNDFDEASYDEDDSYDEEYASEVSLVRSC